jgi:hypothetical protein
MFYLELTNFCSCVIHRVRRAWTIESSLQITAANGSGQLNVTRESRMKRLLSAALLSSAFAFAPLAANAATVMGSSFPTGTNNYVTSVASGVTGTFTGSGNFTQKTKPDSNGNTWKGVGIAGGRTGDEIDIGESITGAFSSGVIMSAFQLMVLYDGPEFGDVSEKAKVTATLASGGSLSGILEVKYDSVANPLFATWTGTGFGSLTNLSLAREQDAAVWRVFLPFGVNLISGIKFEALSGDFGVAPSTNQTDYALERMEFARTPNEIPEPSTYALMLAGLAMLGFMVRRRTAV